ncbi:MAG: hypothetical protein KDJ43_03870, partial [Rhizobiaceae bacterium]|nr:hypothetical protein [Rhizobiaceae bacterium]
WLYPLLFGLIAVFFAGSARTQRQEQPAQIAFGALLAVLLRVGGFLAVSRAGVSPAFAVAAYAVPLAAIGLFLTLTLTGRSLRIPKFIIEFLTLIATMVRAGMRFGRPQAMPPGSAS